MLRNFSDFIKVGCEGTQQNFGDMKEDNKYCVVGAAALGYAREVLGSEEITYAMSDPYFSGFLYIPMFHPYSNIKTNLVDVAVYLNDSLKWTREDIAEYFVGKGL